MSATLTYKTSQGFVTGELQIWISVILEMMPAEIRARIFEEVKKRETEKLVLMNPDGTTTTVLRAQKGALKANGLGG